MIAAEIQLSQRRIRLLQRLAQRFRARVADLIAAEIQLSQRRIRLLQRLAQRVRARVADLIAAENQLSQRLAQRPRARVADAVGVESQLCQRRLGHRQRLAQRRRARGADVVGAETQLRQRRLGRLQGFAKSCRARGADVIDAEIQHRQRRLGHLQRLAQRPRAGCANVVEMQADGGTAVGVGVAFSHGTQERRDARVADLEERCHIPPRRLDGELRHAQAAALRQLSELVHAQLHVVVQAQRVQRGGGGSFDSGFVGVGVVSRGLLPGGGSGGSGSGVAARRQREKRSAGTPFEQVSQVQLRPRVADGGLGRGGEHRLARGHEAHAVLDRKAHHDLDEQLWRQTSQAILRGAPAAPHTRAQRRRWWKGKCRARTPVRLCPTGQARELRGRASRASPLRETTQRRS